MKSTPVIKCLLAVLIVSVSLGISSASVQEFESSIGTIKIDIPYAVELGDMSGNDSLQLVEPGTTKPIISINLWDSAMYKQLYPTFQEFAESFVGTGHEFEEMTTDEGKPMLFSVIQEGTDREGSDLRIPRVYRRFRAKREVCSNSCAQQGSLSRKSHSHIHQGTVCRNLQILCG